MNIQSREPRVSLETETGEIVLDQFVALDLASLREWISTRLYGTATQSSGDKDGLPHFLIELLYGRSPSATRENIRIALRELLDEWGIIGGTTPNEARFRLLMLIPLLADSREGSAAIGTLIDSLAFIEGQQELARRVLQALCGLGYRGTEEFWKAQYVSHGKDVGAVVFSALLALNVSAAILWLNEVRDRKMIAAAAAVLPGFLEQHGSTVFLNGLRSVYPRLSAEIGENLLLLLQDEGVALPVLPESAEEWEVFFTEWLNSGRASFYVSQEVLVPTPSLIAKAEPVALRDAIRNILVRWTPFEGHTLDFSDRMVTLLDMYHSPDSVAALVGAIHSIVRVKQYLTIDDWDLARQFIDILSKHAVTIGLLDRDSGDTSLWLRYLDSLRLALHFEPISLDVFSQVVLYLPDEVELSLLHVLQHASVDVFGCLEILTDVLQPLEAQDVLRRSAILFSRSGGSEVVAQKLLEYFSSSAEQEYEDSELEAALFLLRHASVAESASAWVSDITASTRWRA